MVKLLTFCFDVRFLLLLFFHSPGSRMSANTSGTIYLSSGSGISAPPIPHPQQQQQTSPQQQQQQQQPQQLRFTRSPTNATATTVTRVGMLPGGQVVMTAPGPLVRPPGKVDSSNSSLANHRPFKNVPPNNRPAPANRTLVPASARRLSLVNSSLPSPSSCSTVTPPSPSSAAHARPATQDFVQQQSLSQPQNYSSPDVITSPNNESVVGSSRLGTASQPPPFATPNSSSHHKDVRVSSSPLRGVASAVPSSPSSSSSSSQVLSASQSLHLPNGLRTLPPGHPASRFVGGDRTRGSVTVVGTTADVLGLSNAAKGPEPVSAATHLLASSGSRVASKHLSSSS